MGRLQVADTVTVTTQQTWAHPVSHTGNLCLSVSHHDVVNQLRTGSRPHKKLLQQKQTTYRSFVLHEGIMRSEAASIGMPTT